MKKEVNMVNMWIAEWLDGETDEGMVTNALKVLKNE